MRSQLRFARWVVFIVIPMIVSSLGYGYTTLIFWLVVASLLVGFLFGVLESNVSE